MNNTLKNADEKGKVTIIYGAGRQAELLLPKLKSMWIHPVAFCDSDEKKAGKDYLGLPVLSRKEVIRKYGKDFDVWISPASPIREQIWHEIIESGFVEEHRVLNLSKSAISEKKYKGCASLNSVAVVGSRGIYCCCTLDGDLRNESPYVQFDGTMGEAVEKFVAKKTDLIEKLRNGHPSVCDGCPEVREDYWEEDDRIHVLAVSPSFPCQLSCSYCSVPSNARLIKENRDWLNSVNKVDIKEIIEGFEKKGMLDLREPIQLSAGEITIHPQKEEILTYLSKYPLQIFSNCVFYDAQVSSLISRDGSFLNVSLDAGTRETFHKIKGMDAYDKVIKNITRYKEEGGHIEIKYILLPENCDDRNIDGFIEFCRATNIDFVNISCDISADHQNLPKEILDGAIKLSKKAAEIGMAYRVLPYFGTENMAYIENNIKK